jgi:hypothetical protein
MNLDDLRRELNARSQDADSSDPDLTPGIERKIRTTKRRRLTGAAAAAAAIAMVLAAQGLLQHEGSRPSYSIDNPVMPSPIEYPLDPSVIVSPPAGDVTSAGVTYRKHLGGRTLLAAVIGKPGQLSVTLRWKVSTTNVVLYEYCADPGTIELSRVELSRDGETLGAAGACTPPSVQGPAMLPRYVTDVGLSRLEQVGPITVGSTLELTYAFEKLAEGMQPSSEARLGLAIYGGG